MDSLDSILSVNSESYRQTKIMFTDVDINGILNIQGNDKKSQEQELKKLIKNTNTDNVDIDDWFE